MIAGQSGETQWVLHQNEASSNTSDPSVASSGGEPIVSDPPPYGGSNFDPVNPHLVPFTENPAKPALNQTYATLPLSFMGPQITSIIKSDANPAVDLADVQDDIGIIASKNMKQIQWGWYQQGFDTEPTDGTNPASHSGYVTHHNGPQYFGYVADNTAEVLHLHGSQDFFNGRPGTVAAAAGRRVLPARRLQQQRLPRAGRPEPRGPGRLPGATTITRATPTPRSRRDWWRTRSTPSR